MSTKSPSEKHRALTLATLDRVNVLLHVSHAALQEAEELERLWVDDLEAELGARLAVDPLIAVMERVPRPRRVAQRVPAHALAACTCVAGVEGGVDRDCPVHAAT
jgi:hypothetical protein